VLLFPGAATGLTLPRPRRKRARQPASRELEVPFTSSKPVA
jgi:hypothetical protein